MNLIPYLGFTINNVIIDFSSQSAQTKFQSLLILIIKSVSRNKFELLVVLIHDSIYLRQF